MQVLLKDYWFKSRKYDFPLKVDMVLNGSYKCFNSKGEVVIVPCSSVLYQIVDRESLSDLNKRLKTYQT